MTDFTKRLGYGGSAEVAGAQVVITSGSFSNSEATAFLEMIDTPPSQTKASRVIHADGTEAHSGSIGFDVTQESMSIFSTTALFKRFYEFDVGIHDGENKYVMSKCKLTSLTLSGSAGGLVAATLSFMSLDAESSGLVSNNFIRDDDLVAYWWSGSKSPKTKSWSLSMTQDIQMAYRNVDETSPLYLRVGLVDYSLEVESYTPIVGNSDTVSICTSSFTLTGRTNERGFQYGGLTELGTYTYVFGSGSDTGASDGVVIS